MVIKKVQAVYDDYGTNTITKSMNVLQNGYLGLAAKSYETDIQVNCLITTTDIYVCMHI